MNFAPILLFVYNRPWHTRQTVEALRKNELASKSKLFIYSDAPKNEQDQKNVQEVRDYIQTIDGFKKITVIERKKNWGLADSIIDGVTAILNKYKRVIVLEDDLVTSPFFLNYMNNGLDFYEFEDQIFTISAYNHPPSLMKFPQRYPHDIYFNYRNSSWGWATWKDRWKKADWDIKDFNLFKNDKKRQSTFNRGGDDMSEMLISQMEGEINSWAIRWSYTHFEHNAFSVCPVISYVDNVGHDGSGVHCGKNKKFTNDLLLSKKNVAFISDLEINEEIMSCFARVYKRGLKYRAKQAIKKLICYEMWKA